MKGIRFGALLVALAAVPAFAAPQTWTGTISDSMCGAKHMEGEHGMKVSDKACTEMCVKKGATYVFVSDADGRLSRLDARRTFLLTIQQEHVDVLETLRAALVDGPNVDAWARRWGLTDEWILDVARRGVRSGPFTDVLRKWKFGMASESLPDLIDDEDRAAIEDLAQPAAADPVTENRVAYVARAAERDRDGSGLSRRLSWHAGQFGRN